MKIFVFTLLFLVCVVTNAQMVTSYPEFTPAEIATHKANINVVTSTAAACLNSTWDEHVAFFNKWHVSKFYGNRKPEHKTEDLRRAALKKYGAPAQLISELEPISCVGLTVQCLGKGFEAAGQTETFAKIYARLAVGNNFLGTDLIYMLRELGWKVAYWNPDPSQNAAWDAEDRLLSPLQKGKVWNAVWGGHALRYATVIKKKTYAGINVDDTELLNGFRLTPPPEFTKQEFFVGVAHAGYHVFPGSKGQVIEAHSMRNLNSIDNLQVSYFNPLAPNGGPRWTRSEKYRSGIMALPPSP